MRYHRNFAKQTSWKQRDIHEKREARKLKLAKLNSELSLNAVLRPRISTVLTGLNDKGISYIRSVQRRIKEQPSDERPSTGAANQPTYDQMMGQLLSDVWREAAYLTDGAVFEKGSVMKDGKKVDEKTPLPDWAEGDIPESKKEGMGQRLGERLSWHLKELDRRDLEVKKEIGDEEKEQKKHITSEDIREGWSKTSVPEVKPSPLEDRPKGKKEKTEVIEVLNPGASVSRSHSSTRGCIVASGKDGSRYHSTPPILRPAKTSTGSMNR